MLINLRDALMTGKRLPYDAEVEYLESTGTQYIDTGVAPNDDTFEMSLTFMALAYNDGCCGTSAGSDNGNCYLNFWSGGVFVRKDGYSSNSTDKDSWNNGGIYFPNGWNNIQLASDIVINGHIVQSNIPKSPNPNASNAILFAYKRLTNIQAFASMRISKCVIKVNGVLVRDYIPVRKGTVGYLYDRVSGRLFGNAGTGDFQYGPDVVPVEYIQQTGTQYIDTLYPMADVRREEIVVDWSGHSTTYREFMAGSSSGSYLIEMSPTGYYGTAPGNLSSIQVGTKDKIRWDYEVGVKPSIYINDVFAIQDTLVRVPTGNIETGGVGTPGQNYPKMKIYSLDVYTDNNLRVRKMLPVRVGTEGAMMDVLTRRIYRNAGTGAFTYGNDIKYPIPAA